MSLLDETMGAAFIGVVVAAVLYGVACLQILYYYSSYRDDLWRLKFLVFAVWLSETFHQALITHAVYTYLIKDFGDSDALGEIVWSLVVQVPFSGSTALLVQSFYMFRIWNLSENNIWLSTLVLLLVLGEFGAILAYTAKASRLRTFTELAQLKDLSMVVNVLAAVGDLLIAVTLAVLLYKSRTGYKRSDGLIHKLILFTVNTGLLTSICAICSLVAIIVLPNAFIYVAFFFVMGRLYANSLLATLNARQILRMSTVADEVLSLSLHALRGMDTFSTSEANRLPIASNTKGQSQEEICDLQSVKAAEA